MCFPHGEFLIGSGDVLLGEAEGCAFSIDAALDQAWNHPRLVLDVADGDPEGFSLSAGPGRHFVTRSSSAPAGARCRVCGAYTGQPAGSG
jgi:uncharacterized protein (DUF779 family)